MDAACPAAGDSGSQALLAVTAPGGAALTALAQLPQLARPEVLARVRARNGVGMSVSCGRYSAGRWASQ